MTMPAWATQLLIACIVCATLIILANILADAGAFR